MCRISLFVVALAALIPAQTPQWIWGHWAPRIANQPDGERCFARHTFELAKKPDKATLEVSCDNRFVAWVNGKKVGEGTSWETGASIGVAGHLRAGKNVIAIRGENEGGPAGLFARLKVGGRVVMGTSGSWLTTNKAEGKWRTPGFDAGGWKPASELAPFGGGPWGKPGFGKGGRRGRPAPPDRPDDYAPLAGFEAKEVASGFGSLINLCLDDEDRPIVSVERKGVLRLHDDDGDGVYERAESVTDRVRSCQGLLYSRGGFYVVGHGPKGPGLYRIEEGGGDSPKLIGGFNGGMGEHGPHAIIEGPDDRLYGVIGNHTKLKAEWSAASPYRLHDEGHLLPRYLDPRGHARGIRSPGGLIYSVDRQGKDWRVIAAGFRNSYDIAFNRHGELFTYDSDMEWDIGMPWYRPTRLYHVVPGGEYGWRTGSSKWPDIYPDSLPAAIDCGRGSPCGVVTYDGTTFPERFQGALFGADWAQGRILAFHLAASGDTYKGRTEVLLSGRPLNVTDLAIDGKGALIFTCGGRGTRGSVGRLTYGKPVGVEGVRPRPRPLPVAVNDAARAAALGSAGPENRFSRFVAARGFERDPSKLPEDSALNPTAFAEAVVVAARAGLDRFAPDAVAARFLETTDIEVRRALLRGLQLLLRKEGASLQPAISQRLLEKYPTGDRAADRELASVIAHGAPDGATERLVRALEEEQSRAEQIHLAYCLRVIDGDWSLDQKLRVFRWIVRAQEWSGGASYRGFVKALRGDFEKKLDDGDRAALGALLKVKPGQGRVHLVQGAPRRDFTRTLDFLRNSLGTERRSLHEGARVFAKSCVVCHKFGADGAGVGPDLTAAANRYTLEDLLTTVVDPSREISDQYRAIDVFTKDDELVSGLVVSENGEKIVLLQGTGEQVEVPVSNIDTRRFAKTSGMPEGLLDGLSLEEAADLFYYLRSGTPIAAPRAASWQPLFNGKDLSGWSGRDGLWKVENGVVIGEMVGGKVNTFLISNKSYGDFVIQFEMLLEEGNSGLQFRSEQLADLDHVMAGYQADAGANFWGSLYEERGRGMLNQAERVDWEPAFERGGWNHFVIEAEGDRIRITLNGCPTTVIRDGRTPSGKFGFQLHAGKRTKIRVRNALIQVR